MPDVATPAKVYTVVPAKVLFHQDMNKISFQQNWIRFHQDSLNNESFQQNYGRFHKNRLVSFQLRGTRFQQIRSAN